jgi:transposase
VRDLWRGREVAKEDLLRCRHRLSKVLLRRGFVYSGGKKAWRQAHRKWLRSLRFANTLDQTVLADYLHQRRKDYSITATPSVCPERAAR